MEPILILLISIYRETCLKRNLNEEKICPYWNVLCSEYILRVKGRAIAQAVTRWLPPAAARVRSRLWSSGICCGQSGAWAGFLRVLRFPLPIRSTKFSILTIIRGRYNRPRINGRRTEWTQFGLHPPLCKLKKNWLIGTVMNWQPITVSSRFKARTVSASSNTEIVGSNPTQDMDVCIVCVYCVFVLACV
jgi:hypothetical protein